MEPVTNKGGITIDLRDSNPVSKHVTLLLNNPVLCKISNNGIHKMALLLGKTQLLAHATLFESLFYEE
jgi:hypothetical protein